MSTPMLVVFVAEPAARLYAHRLRFFRDPWNCFDFVVVGVSLLPAAGPLSVLRALRDEVRAPALEPLGRTGTAEAARRN